MTVSALIRSTRLILIVCFYTLSAFTASPSLELASEKEQIPDPLTAEVIGIQDGDTIELKYIFAGKSAGHRQGMPLRIRFMHINCPERGKPYYKVAKQYTSKMCFRTKVHIRHNGEFDKYGRLIGEVILSNGENLNKTLVRNGLAVHYKKYSSDRAYAELENGARANKVGIWSQEILNLGR